jgi:hypothetical protein
MLDGGRLLRQGRRNVDSERCKQSSHHTRLAQLVRPNKRIPLKHATVSPHSLLLLEPLLPFKLLGSDVQASVVSPFANGISSRALLQSTRTFFRRRSALYLARLAWSMDSCWDSHGLLL